MDILIAIPLQFGENLGSYAKAEGESHEELIEHCPQSSIELNPNHPIGLVKLIFFARHLTAFFRQVVFPPDIHQ